MDKDQALKANQEMIKRIGLDKIQKLGFLGQGVNIFCLENIPDVDGHDKNVKDSFLAFGPKANVIVRQNEMQAWIDAIASLQPGFVGPRIHIINISMTGFNLELSREYVRLGGIVVCATGNGTVSDFSGWLHVIDVGRVYEDLRKASESASSSTLDLVCFNPWIPGSDSYFQQNGTSFASPSAGGGMSCLLGYWMSVGYTDNMRAYLLRHAEDIGAPGRDNQTGAGLIKFDLLDHVDFPVGKNIYQFKDLEPVKIDLGAQPFKVEGGLRNLVPIRHLLDAQNDWIKRTGKKISNLCPTWVPPKGDQGIVRVFID